MNLKEEENYLEINRENWNARTHAHVDSDFYDLKGFLEGNTSLNPPELELLGDISGKSVLHLQCHFGLDTMSMARMGANSVGVDLSDAAIEKAIEINNDTNLNSRFVSCDLYSLPEHLDEKFDLVFTSYGTTGWLPDIEKWGEIVGRYLKPGGRFVIVDFHPVIWMLDEEHIEKVTYRYFKDEAIIDEEEGSYANRETNQKIKSVSWNHSLSEIVGSLLAQGLKLIDFQEYDYSSYNCFPNMVKEADKMYRPIKVGNKVPMMYSLVMEMAL